MKIGIYSPGYFFGREGGITTYTRHLGHSLSELGHEVHVLAPGLPRRCLTDGPVTVHRAFEGYVRVVDRVIPRAGVCYRVAAAMGRLAARYGLDLVEFPNWEGVGLGYALRPRRRSALVVRLHTSSAESQEIAGTAADRAGRWDVCRERWLGRRADALVTHSFAHRARVATELGLPESRIAVIPHGIPADPLWERPDRPPGPPRVVFLGRLERRKGASILLAAIPGVLRAHPDAVFDFIGGPDLPHCPGGLTHARYVAEVLPEKARAAVRFLGRLPDDEVTRRLQAADLFVAPSRYESFGLVYLEAMRWGTPVVGCAVGGVPEVVEDGCTGVLVPPSDPASLAAAVGGLLGDAERRKIMGDAGRADVLDRFSLPKMGVRVAEFYARTVGGC